MESPPSLDYRSLPVVLLGATQGNGSGSGAPPESRSYNSMGRSIEINGGSSLNVACTYPNPGN